MEGGPRQQGHHIRWPEGKKSGTLLYKLKLFFTKIPTILLANKSDLTDQRSVTDDEVYKLSRELGFTSWYSVSARDGDNVDTAGDMIVSQILQREIGLDRMERLLRWPERGVRLKDQQGQNVKKKKCCEK